MIQKERINVLNRTRRRNGHFVLYWMQASQRAEYNHALEYGIRIANRINRPLVVYFGITDTYPEANKRHYHFMLQGLKEVKASLEGRGIEMVIRHESPEFGVVELAKNASLVVADRGYLRIQWMWRTHVAQNVDCPLIQVESDVIVPVEEASPKEEFSAATFRPKVIRRLTQYLVPIREQSPRTSSPKFEFDSIDIENAERAVSVLNIDKTVEEVGHFHGGTSEAKKNLEIFLGSKLERYAELRNDPNADHVSDISPYLHFGQISPLYVALKVWETQSLGREAYLEELITRRELSINFVHYNQDYDSFHGLPEWAKKTLREHENDPREHIYTLQELENAKTHDSYWNAAQRQMTVTGKMHGYMRMYWGKKIIEWSRTSEEAFKTALYLNNKYELDGRDPNSFAGVAWCFGKHDRPWSERPIFGKTRYMSADGLRRKFDAERYAARHM